MANKLPDKYTPKALLPEEPRPRREVVYAIGDEHQPGSYGMWHGPDPDVFAMLEVVPDHEHILSCIIRFNLDGTDEVIYRWKQFRGGKPPCWVKEPGVE